MGEKYHETLGFLQITSQKKSHQLQNIKSIVGKVSVVSKKIKNCVGEI